MDKLLITKVKLEDKSFYAIRPQGYIDKLYQRLGRLPGLSYNKKLRVNLLPDRPGVESDLEALFGEGCLNFQFELTLSDARSNLPPRKVVQSTPTHLTRVWIEVLQRTEKQLKVQRYSPQTIRTYLSHLKGFAKEHGHVSPGEVNRETIQTYIIQRSERGNYAEATT